MNRRRSLAIILATTLITGLVALLLWRSEPRYSGRSLTDWAIQAQDYEKMALTDKPDYLAASNAIYQMGPAAAKTAVDWLESDINWVSSPISRWLPSLRRPFRGEPRLDRGSAIPMLFKLSGKDGRSSVGERLWRIRSKPSVGFLREYVDDLLLAKGGETNRLADAIGTNYLSNSAELQFHSSKAIFWAQKLRNLSPAGRRYLEAGLTNQNESVIQTSQNALAR